jgi:hypothetical protein
MKQANAYVIISLVFFIIIGVGFAYSYFFYPNAHPVDCIVRSYTGVDCPTCGFSRSFSYYSHFEYGLGRKFNKLSWPVFLFFAAQFFLRSSVVAYYYCGVRKFSNTFVTVDIIISISTFLLAFLPIILKF